METIFIGIIVVIFTLVGVGLVFEPFIRHINNKINEEQEDGNNTQ